MTTRKLRRFASSLSFLVSLSAIVAGNAHAASGVVTYYARSRNLPPTTLTARLEIDWGRRVFRLRDTDLIGEVSKEGTLALSTFDDRPVVMLRNGIFGGPIECPVCRKMPPNFISAMYEMKPDGTLEYVMGSLNSALDLILAPEPLLAGSPPEDLRSLDGMYRFETVDPKQMCGPKVPCEFKIDVKAMQITLFLPNGPKVRSIGSYVVGTPVRGTLVLQVPHPFYGNPTSAIPSKDRIEFSAPNAWPALVR